MRHRALRVLLLSLGGVACGPTHQPGAIWDDACQPTRAFVDTRIVQATRKTVDSAASGQLVILFPAEVAQFGAHGVAGVYLLRDSTDARPLIVAIADSTRSATLPSVPEGRQFLRLRAIGFTSHLVAVDARAGFVDTLIVHARSTECRRAAG